MTTFHRTVALCAVLAVATPAWARQSVSRSEPDDPAKAQVQTFEIILKVAVETGSRNFAKRAQEMVPVVFSPGDAPVVNGVAFRVSDRTEFVFHIQVPFIWPAIQVMNMMANRSLPGGMQGVSSPGRVQADGLVVADPMAPVAANRPDLEREYAMSVRGALIDAMLDNSGGLPITGADSLLVYASGSDSDVSVNPLYKTALRKLVLSISGADLTEFRQGKITRDEARQRVKVQSF